LTAPVPERRREIRDAVHAFVDLDEYERKVVDSRPFQRLRHVNQLALSNLVYPGATHRRFEHSLGVMELAGRIFDTVTREDKLTDAVREVVPPRDSMDYAYARNALRMAALLHDTGHLPFSHAAEEELLPEGFDHERITYEIIHSDEMQAVWGTMTVPPKPELIAKIALGPRTVEKLGLSLSFDTWEAILAEMVAGEVFGADRIDYLLRDSLHTGVAYGRFDHHRLISTLCILPLPTAPADEAEASGDQPELALGIERGGIEAAEGLLLARYFMFSQVYLHPTRLIYDEHLKDFLASWLPDGRFATDVESHLQMTDNEVTAALLAAARDPQDAGHEPARRVVERDHFRVAYQRGAQDTRESMHDLAQAARERYGAEHVRHAGGSRGSDPVFFAVRDRDGRSVSSLALSAVLNDIPASRNEYIFVAAEQRREAARWLDEQRQEIVDQAAADLNDTQEVNP
jgi:HD superfamily phosphohydrolase